MNLLSIQLGLFGLLRIATSTFVAEWMSSPMSWSPDGEWLSYTVVTDAEPDRLRPAWTFLSANAGSEPPGPHGPVSRGTVAPPAIYRIWATNRGRQPSVLIEESRWPLTAPAWSPRGKAIAFGRFVPHSIEPTQSSPERPL